MRRAHRRVPIVAVLAAGLLGSLADCGRTCQAQDDSNDTSAVAAAHYDHYAGQARELSLKPHGGERLTLRETPLQTFSIGDATFGSVFLWLNADNRPAAIGTLGSLPIAGRDFGFTEMHWLLAQPMDPIAVEGRLQIRWAPSGKDIVPKPLNDVAPVAQSDPARLIQMRNIARQFEADMVNNKERNKLRLLPQPLYRYPDSSPEREGAIFAWIWTVGTDPEVLMHIYSQKVGEQNVWFYQPLRFTYRAVELRRHGQEVWRADEFFERERPQQSGAYMTALTVPIELDAKK